MRGVEMASFVNDICGKPVESENFFLKKYFDGPNFYDWYQKLTKTNFDISRIDDVSRFV